MADASTAGKEVTAPLTQGYGALEFASDRDLISRGPLSLYEVDAYTMIMNGGLQQIKDYLQNFGKDLGYCRYFAFLCIR